MDLKSACLRFRDSLLNIWNNNVLTCHLLDSACASECFISRKYSGQVNSPKAVYLSCYHSQIGNSAGMGYTPNPDTCTEVNCDKMGITVQMFSHVSQQPHL